MDVKFEMPRNPDGSKPERVRVYPKNEAMRRGLRHPTGNIRFGGTVGESVEWPLDQFTYRRLSDGDVLLHAPGDEAQFREAAPQPEPQPPAEPPPPPPEQPQ